jgi:predicted transposase YdaD
LTIADWDGAWKDSLTTFLRHFLALFFPQVHDDIDWSRGFEPLDKELQKIAPDAETGRRTVDLLFRVWRRSGEERWVLIHIEVQAQRVAGFSARVHHYHFRIFDQYRLPVASFVVLADNEPGWRPGPYTYDLWGCRGEFHFPTVKLLDFAERADELEKSSNPFALVVLAHLKARETANDHGRRISWKVRLLKSLYDRRWTREEVRQLLRTIDWFLTLSKADNQTVREAIEADEQEKKMPYISSFEQMAMEQGEARGEARGRVEGIALALKLKFGEAGQQLAAEVREINNLETLKRVTDSIEAAASPEEVRRIWAD